ncbi:MAG: lysophospholipid acyltransferase family protein, partial [Pseudomonadota bacterium]
FVSKAEVAGWPGIGWLARATGTVFIERRRSEAARHTGMLAERMAMGHRLMVFPEGTSTDGQRVLPFRPTLLAAFMGEDAPEGARIQPVTVIYEAPDGAPHDFYGWWGDMSFDRHLLNVLMVRRPGSVRVIFHPAVAVGTDRKALARSLRDAVAAPMEQAV